LMKQENRKNRLRGRLSRIHAVELATDEHRSNTGREKNDETGAVKKTPLSDRHFHSPIAAKPFLIRVSSVFIRGSIESLRLRDRNRHFIFLFPVFLLP